MAGESRHHEDSWFHHVRLLCEVDQSPKRGRLDRFLADGHELSVHAHFVDAKGRPRVGQSHPGDHLVSGREPSDHRVVAERSGKDVDRVHEESSDRLCRRHEVHLCLVRPVEHQSSRGTTDCVEQRYRRGSR